ncbi:hypothetical protein E2C01_021223 [Portunus trituberculatus]|uniref:Uncharacterized protein n=1 Tax=Portunus trituberculatus TaxID=210409 RepID=A0A5B7E247_PORTR|nr:hypothetical protein [Portunus trituberculatus]
MIENAFPDYNDQTLKPRFRIFYKTPIENFCQNLQQAMVGWGQQGQATVRAGQFPKCVCQDSPGTPAALAPHLLSFPGGTGSQSPWAIKSIQPKTCRSVHQCIVVR